MRWYFEGHTSLIASPNQFLEDRGKVDDPLPDGQMKIILHMISTSIVMSVDVVDSPRPEVNDFKGYVLLSQNLSVADVQRDAQLRAAFEKGLKILRTLA
jgi:hypothetical protein